MSQASSLSLITFKKNRCNWLQTQQGPGDRAPSSVNTQVKIFPRISVTSAKGDSPGLGSCRIQGYVLRMGMAWTSSVQCRMEYRILPSSLRMMMDGFTACDKAEKCPLSCTSEFRLPSANRFPCVFQRWKTNVFSPWVQSDQSKARFERSFPIPRSKERQCGKAYENLVSR
jgi:hypothetical protein